MNSPAESPLSFKTSSFLIVTGTIIFVATLSSPFIGVLPKDTNLTGIVILRDSLLYLPLAFSFLQLVIACTDLLGKPNQIKLKNNSTAYSRNVFKVKLAQNLFFFLTFVLIYFCFFKPLHSETGFRLSGHVTGMSIANEMFKNCLEANEVLLTEVKKRKSAIQVLNYIIVFLLAHNYYTLFFTVACFHTFLECLLAFLTVCVAIVAVNLIDLDKLLMKLIIEESN